MRLRRLAGLVVLAGLLAVAGVAVWRSVGARPPGTADRIAAGLRCPACDGETVAQSQSPVAAAMRATIAQQLAAGRSPEQIRAWFVDRYGRGILAEPALDGTGLVLWLVPGLVLLVASGLALGTRRRHATQRARAPAARTGAATGSQQRRARIWTVSAACLTATVLAVAAGGHYLTARVAATVAPPSPEPVAPSDPAQASLLAAESLEQQGQYAAAADMYRQVNAEHADDNVALRLAFVLVRAGEPDQAVPVAQGVLKHRADDPDALLVLGLAQRAAHLADADATLRRYLTVAPQAPAAAEVRRLLGQP